MTPFNLSSYLRRSTWLVGGEGKGWGPGSDASGLLGGPLVDGVLHDGREDGPALLLLLGHGSDAAERASGAARLGNSHSKKAITDLNVALDLGFSRRARKA